MFYHFVFFSVEKAPPSLLPYLADSFSPRLSVTRPHSCPKGCFTLNIRVGLKWSLAAWRKKLLYLWRRAGIASVTFIFEKPRCLGSAAGSHCRDDAPQNFRSRRDLNSSQECGRTELKGVHVRGSLTHRGLLRVHVNTCLSFYS